MRKGVMLYPCGLELREIIQTNFMRKESLTVLHHTLSRPYSLVFFVGCGVQPCVCLSLRNNSIVRPMVFLKPG